MRPVYDSDDSTLAAAMAASAYAVHVIDQETSRLPQLKRAHTQKCHEPFEHPPLPIGSVRKLPSSIKDRSAPSSSSFLRPGADGQRHVRDRSDAWEEAQLLKIRKQYDNIIREIQAWENHKKMKETRRIKRKKEEIEVRTSINLKHYYGKIAKIGNVADGARERAEEKRRREEASVREKARRMRSTGKAPLKYCFCF
ncbi:remorin 1.4 [Andrographis paniculata]|uniref:remorin 1.4 n=1 Tax=Andrographis paniculata TaxID=175694 RepID=UPI0021E70DCD|nr:remorin 1.4 [Andrographis paniculata]